MNEFAGAAQRIRAAGFDGTELDGATNHPPQQLPVPSVEKAAGFDEITDAGLVIVTKEGEREIIKADTIVTAMPMPPNTEFLKELEGSALEWHAIGDAREPNVIMYAIADGSRIARAI